jgi:uncharacterized protein YjbI with pentapeptide repeats
VLRDCNLSYARLRNTVLTEADLTGAELGNVDLTSAQLLRTRLDLAGALALAEAHGAVVV